MTSRIVVFGATGYTGRLVAERLAAQGARPVLAGRDERRLGELAERLGGLETVKADAMRRNSVFAAVEPGDVLISTVGPFAKWGDAAVRAAIAATGATYIDSTGEPVFIRRVFVEMGGPAERVRTFDVKGKARSAISVGGAEHFTLPPAHAALLEVNVYLGWFGPLAKPLQAGALAGTVALKLPGMRSVLQAAGERLVSLAGAPEPGTTPDTLSWIAAVAYDPLGEPLAEVHVTGTDAYDFTASFMAWAAQRAAGGNRPHVVGAAGPVEAFGLDALEEGCAEAGLTRLRDPAAV